MQTGQALWDARSVRLEEIERYYDTVPRAAGTAEDVGPFTLFVAGPETGWRFYARPRLAETAAYTPEDVRRVLARQRELGVPQAIEWVDEITPSLLPAVRAAVPASAPGVHPLLELGPGVALTGEEPPGRQSILGPDDDDLPVAAAVVAAAFAGRDEISVTGAGNRGELIAAGLLAVVASYDEQGELVGAGVAAPRGDTSELMGIGVLPHARRQGRAGAITRELVRAVRAQGVETAFLSAGSDEAAGVYRAVGFSRIGTACILGVDDD